MDATVTDPIVGRLLDGRYLIGRRIARGGMATVYQATDTRLERVVAVKVMHAAFAEDAEFVRRFQREARSAALLSHPHVVAVFDQGRDAASGLVYLAMEYVPGRTLRSVLSAQGPLDPSEALRLLAPILDALSAAHRAGLVHRDIKPENVLIGVDGTVKVADFGLARAVHTNTATQGMLIGTVSYLAPEQLTTGIADARTDVYAAGIVLYEMLLGRKPHEGDTPIQVAYKHVNTDVPEPSAALDGLPRFVDGLVLRATARDPDVRPADARVLLQYVRRAQVALERGIDDPELAEDLLAFRRTAMPTATAATAEESVTRRLEHTSVVPLVEPSHGDEADPAGRTTEEVRGPGASGPRRPRIGSLRARRLGLVALVLITLVGGTVAWWLSSGRYTEVPRVLDATPARLEQLADASGLRFEVVGKDWHDVIAPGRAIRSSPAAGTRVLGGETVRVWVSKGPEKHPVPKVVGLTEKAAMAELERAKLKIGKVERPYRDEIPAGKVVAISPEPGAVVVKNTRVRLVVSAGPAPTRIPALRGRGLTEAKQALQKAGLRWKLSERYDDEIPRGSIVAQDPGPGEAHRGDTVALVVSKGPEFVVVPQVRGAKGADAERRLRALGFDVVVERNDFYVGIGVVVRQTPVAGSRARYGSEVVLEIV